MSVSWWWWTVVIFAAGAGATAVAGFVGLAVFSVAFVIGAFYGELGAG